MEYAGERKGGYLHPMAAQRISAVLALEVQKRMGRPPLPKDLRKMIREMAAENPIWGEERIANELKLKLGIRVSPRTRGEVLARRPGAGARSQAALADL